MNAPAKHELKSFLLSIPMELRLQIYDYCLEDARVVTVSSARVVDDAKDSVLAATSPSITAINCPEDKPQDRPTSLTSNQTSRHNVPGLPADYVPMVKGYYDPALLSLSDPPTITSQELDQNQEIQGFCHTTQALLQTCTQVYDELSDYLRRHQATTPGLSLYVSYPHGVLVLQERYPELLKQARHVYLSGYYSPQKKEEPVPVHVQLVEDVIPTPISLRPILRMGTPPPYFPPNAFPLPSFAPETASEGPKAVANMVRTIMPPTPLPLLQSVQARLFYPGECSYSSVWSDESSPICHVLRNICGGKIDMKVYRGRLGNAVALTAKPQPNARHLTNYWPKMPRAIEEVEKLMAPTQWGEA
ncbi:hypothetical protein BDV96DRAFT_643158 [Lophiotrema nucula]|uniref:Uncharacterized protein n=1 Tax=Lophiotrema nucula TaxID=690887 RepID=A0A6A5ZJF8_9PLEO|nr:hypothetical protein BDV96DRAFT_643158 [Lophiotrema nucula]